MKSKRLLSILVLLMIIVISVFMYGCNSRTAAAFPSEIKPSLGEAASETKAAASSSDAEIKTSESNNELSSTQIAEEIKKKEEAKKLEADKQEKNKTVQASKNSTADNTTVKTQTTVKPPVTSQQSTAPPTQTPSRLIDKIKAKGNSQQVILVQASSYGTYKVTVDTYEKVDGAWKKVLTNVPGVIGRKGFSKNRKEGDYTSPVGVYHFPYLFGWGGNAGFKMSYKPSNNDDYWISLSDPASYNIWFHREGGPDPSWQKTQYEILGPAQKLYKYAAVMDFNMGSNKIVGKGSGIFLHIKPSSGLGTAGCTAIPEDKLLQVLRWMDPAKNPVIIQGTKADLENM